MAAVTICSDYGNRENKSVTASTFSPSFCHEVTGPDVMTSVFSMLSFFFFYEFSFYSKLNKQKQNF